MKSSTNIVRDFESFHRSHRASVGLNITAHAEYRRFLYTNVYLSLKGQTSLIYNPVLLYLGETFAFNYRHSLAEES